MKWYHKLFSWLGWAAKALYELVAPAVKSAALQFVNCPENQAVALAAAKAAFDRGLKGDKAWNAARDQMLDQFGKSASDIADNWLDTLLQSAYFTLKNSTQE